MTLSRPEVRRHLGREPRSDRERRLEGRPAPARVAAAVVVVVSAMGGETDRLLDLARSVQERPRPPRARRPALHRRAGDHRPPGDDAAGEGLPRVFVHRAPGAHPYRQRAQQGSHPPHRRPAHPGGSGSRAGGGRRRLPGRGRRRQHHHPRPRRLRHHRGRTGRGPRCRRVPDLHRRRRRLYHRSPCRAGGPPPRGPDLRGDAGAREPRREGAPDPVRGVREQVWCALAGAVLARGRPPAPSSAPTSRTTQWSNPSYPASRSIATRPRSPSSECRTVRGSRSRSSVRSRPRTSRST